jgi:hypothetical protein
MPFPQPCRLRIAVFQEFVIAEQQTHRLRHAVRTETGEARPMRGLSVGFAAFVGGVPLRRTESGASWDGGGAGRMDVAQRGGSLRQGSAGAMLGHGDVPETESEIAAIRQCTHSGRPLGTPEFVKDLEQVTKRQLIPQKGGRPGKQAVDKKQEALVFDP